MIKVEPSNQAGVPVYNEVNNEVLRHVRTGEPEYIVDYISEYRQYGDLPLSQVQLPLESDLELPIDIATGELTQSPRQAEFVRSANNYDMDAASASSAAYNDQPSLTQQQFKDEVDINNIIERFVKTGELPGDYQTPSYGDYTETPDFHTALSAVREAAENFMLLPAHLRARFNNDPQQLLEFVSEPSNEAEAVRLGLVRQAPLADAPPPILEAPTTPT